MLRNYLKLAIRNIVRDGIFSLINVTGLAVGIACFLTLFLFIQDELGYDRHLSTFPEELVYRIFVRSHIGGVDDSNSKTSGALGPALMQAYPEVLTFTRIGYLGPRTFLNEGKVFRSGSIYAVDSTFFRFFRLTFIEGDAGSALDRPNSLVLTRSAAKRIFGDENPVGRTLPTESGNTFLVTGLVQDFPKNSHFRCDYLESLYTYPVNESWLDLWYTTYIALRPASDFRALEAKLPKLVHDRVGPEAEQVLGVSMDDFLRQGNEYGFYLQPLRDIYLKSQRQYGIDTNTEWGNVANSDIVYVYMFSAIAGFILLLAVINFMNLATARSEKRSREVGIRKTFGSSRSALVLQFVGEAVITCTLAVLVALGIVAGILPLFNNLVERELHLVLIDKVYTVPILIGFVLVVGLSAGSYPAFYLSSFRPSAVLKSTEGSVGRKSLLRSSLVVIQFAISICLMVGTLIIKKQIDFIQDKNLGFKKEHLLIIHNPVVLGERLEPFRNDLLATPGVLASTYSSRMFETGVPGKGFLFNKKTGTDPLVCQFVDVDYDFLAAYQIQLHSGRFFSREFPSDENAVVVNEEAVRAFMTDDPLEKELTSLDRRDQGHTYRIIGVTKDFNYESLHTDVRPLVLHLHKPRQPASALAVRVASGDLSGTLAYVENLWKKHAAEGDAIQFSFADETLARQYETETKTRTVSAVFSMLAVFIACIGLYGLAAFVTEQRTREIGIRKVLGSSRLQVIALLSRQFTLWVLLSNSIAWPVAWLVMSNWLSRFAFRIELGAGEFIIAGSITLTIALLTVAYHTSRAANANPVDCLKYE